MDSRKFFCILYALLFTAPAAAQPAFDQLVGGMIQNVRSARTELCKEGMAGIVCRSEFFDLEAKIIGLPIIFAKAQMAKGVERDNLSYEGEGKAIALGDEYKKLIEKYSK